MPQYLLKQTRNLLDPLAIIYKSPSNAKLGSITTLHLPYALRTPPTGPDSRSGAGLETNDDDDDTRDTGGPANDAVSGTTEDDACDMEGPNCDIEGPACDMEGPARDVDGPGRDTADGDSDG